MDALSIAKRLKCKTTPMEDKLTVLNKYVYNTDWGLHGEGTGVPIKHLAELYGSVFKVHRHLYTYCTLRAMDGKVVPTNLPKETIESAHQRSRLVLKAGNLDEGLIELTKGILGIEHLASMWSCCGHGKEEGYLVLISSDTLKTPWHLLEDLGISVKHSALINLGTSVIMPCTFYKTIFLNIPLGKAKELTPGILSVLNKLNKE